VEIITKDATLVNNPQVSSSLEKKIKGSLKFGEIGPWKPWKPWKPWMMVGFLWICSVQSEVPM
jgi:hypothetical protein